MPQYKFKAGLDLEFTESIVADTDEEAERLFLEMFKEYLIRIDLKEIINLKGDDDE